MRLTFASARLSMPVANDMRKGLFIVAERRGHLRIAIYSYRRYLIAGFSICRHAPAPIMARHYHAANAYATYYLRDDRGGLMRYRLFFSEPLSRLIIYAIMPPRQMNYIHAI